jgi:hypothetical protein
MDVPKNQIQLVVEEGPELTEGELEAVGSLLFEWWKRGSENDLREADKTSPIPSGKE